MAEFLLELYSEEIPAGLQARAAGDLARLVGAGLKKAGIEHAQPLVFATPRRLVVVFDKLPKASPDVREERKGPRVGAPEKALEGFMRGAGLKSIDDATIQSDPKKGDFYVVVTLSKGRKTDDILAEIIPDVVRNFPWPKSMRWGAGRLKWVRPLHSIIALLDGRIVKFEIDGVKSGAKTRGHRFMGPDVFKVESFKQYKKDLKSHKVILDGGERADKIAKDARKVAEKAGMVLVEDEGLLREVAGLVEWPVVLMGSFDEAFLDVPPEVLTITMKKHQKCFSVANAKTGKLANRFILVSNLKAKDGGKSITQGNERVIRARLSDAKFFWDNDREQSLGLFVRKLDEVTFHEQLGTQFDRVERIKALALEISAMTGADRDKAGLAAALCKADLLTEMVGEFPDLQGLMGRYIALEQGLDKSVAQAIEDHYKPLGPSDQVPNDPVSVAVALADKLDMLIGFWAIDEKPTGSKDPFALRRAALGVIRLINENALRLPLGGLISEHWQLLQSQISSAYAARVDRGENAISLNPTDVVTLELLAFFADRLKVSLKDQGARHDLIDAVFALGDQSQAQAQAVDDLLMIVKRVEALGEFLETDDGANLLAGVKRAANILRIEEKKDKTRFEGQVDDGLLENKHERALVKMIGQVQKSVDKSLKGEDLGAAMTALAKLRAPVDGFFKHVIVNADDGLVRENRLNILAAIRDLTRQVADFSKVSG